VCKNPSGVLWESVWSFKDNSVVQKTRTSGVFTAPRVVKTDEDVVFSLVQELKAIENANS
jgi:hypothetical protein